MKTRTYSPYEDHTDVRLFFSRTKNVVWRLTATLLGTPRAALILHDSDMTSCRKVLIHVDIITTSSLSCCICDETLLLLHISKLLC